VSNLYEEPNPFDRSEQAFQHHEQITSNEAPFHGEKGGSADLKQEMEESGGNVAPKAIEAGSRTGAEKFTDDIESRILGFIVLGLQGTDATILSGCSAATYHRWMGKGTEYPDSRYGLFVRRVIEAEAKLKGLLISKLRKSDDPRWSWRLLCSRFPKEFADHVVNEMVGPGGIPLPASNQQFQVNVSLSGKEEPIVFSTIDHRDESDREAKSTVLKDAPKARE
jgi:hypothetical protein